MNDNTVLLELLREINQESEVKDVMRACEIAASTIEALQAEVDRLKSTVSYKQVGFVHLKRWQAGNAPEHCFSTEKEQYGDIAIYVEEQNHG